MKALTLDELAAFLRSVESEYDVRVPVALHDGTRALGTLDEGPLALAGGRIPRKPTSVFFPQCEEVFTVAEDGRIRMAQPPEKPILVLGLTAEDADCLEFIDRFFSANYRDDVYFNKRDHAVVVVVSGKCGKDGEFLRIAGGKCDLELVYDGDRYIVVPYSETGKSLETKMPAGEDNGSLKALKKESDALPTDDQDILLKASERIRQDQVPDEFWTEIGDRCIACTGCNLVCPTCTCFDILDWTRGERVERQRIWDSCQLDGFMREASGHNPMGTETLRTRRRIHHKLAADVDRWGHVTCFLCGRCDDACPTGIGIKAVSKEIVARFGSG